MGLRSFAKRVRASLRFALNATIAHWIYTDVVAPQHRRVRMWVCPDCAHDTSAKTCAKCGSAPAADPNVPRPSTTERN
jgi:hypothetical protein